MPKKPSIHTIMRNQVSLAKTYAEDGAFHSAARVLRELALTVEAHAVACDRDLDAMMAERRGEGC